MNPTKAILLATALLLALPAAGATVPGTAEAPRPATVQSTDQDPIACSLREPVASMFCADDEESSEDLGCVNVCAHASAYSGVYWCYDATGTSFRCWLAGMNGSGYGRLGLLTVTLEGMANSVPLADWCNTPLLVISCSVHASVSEYPGAAVAVSGTVTAVTPYGQDFAVAAHATSG